MMAINNTIVAGNFNGSGSDERYLDSVLIANSFNNHWNGWLSRFNERDGQSDQCRQSGIGAG
jgi:hypothetical protein